MGSLHAIHPESHLNIHEQDDVFQHFSGIHFEDFIMSNGIEIQSKRTLRNGTERRNSSKRLSEIWEMHLRRFLVHPKIHLAQMITNYHDADAQSHQKKAIYFKLKEIGLEGIPPTSELEREALMLGIAMMLSDTLDISISLLHAFEYENDVAGVLERKAPKEEAVA